MEIWKPVLGHENHYEISNLGRVRRTSAPMGRTRAGKILTPYVTDDGYETVGLCIDGVAKNRMVHQLVAESFVGDRSGSECVNHRDGNKRNNHPENLEWTSLAVNTRHAFATGLCNNSGERHGMSRLSDCGSRVIRRLCESRRITQREIAQPFNVSQATVSNIGRGIRKVVMS